MTVLRRGSGRSLPGLQPSSPGASSGSIYLVSWNGTAWQSVLARGPGVGAPIWVGAGDFTGTGHDDLAWLTGSTSSSNTALWFFDRAHGFATVGQTTGWGTPEPGVAGDYFGDGQRGIAWFQPASPGASTGSIYLVS